MPDTPVHDEYVPSLDAMRVNFIDGMVRHGNSREDALAAWARGIAAHDDEVRACYRSRLAHTGDTETTSAAGSDLPGGVRPAGQVERALAKASGRLIIWSARLAARREDVHELQHCLAALAVGNTGNRNHGPCMLDTHTGTQAVDELSARMHMHRTAATGDPSQVPPDQADHVDV